MPRLSEIGAELIAASYVATTQHDRSLIPGHWRLQRRWTTLYLRCGITVCFAEPALLLAHYPPHYPTSYIEVDLP